MRQTSIDVYRRIQSEGLLSRMRFKVYDVLYREGPLTGKELDQRLGTDSAHKRLSELKALGVITDSGDITRTCTVSGQVVIEWDVTSGLPTEAPAPQDAQAAQVRPTANDLNKAVSELRELWRYAQAAGHTPDPALVKVGQWLALGAP